MLAGERRPSRLKGPSPEPRDRLPACPKDLDPAAQGVWRRVVREMGATGVITGADHDALRCYSSVVARYIQAEKLLASSPPLIRGARSGDLVKNPLHQIARDLSEQVRLYARELGLTPSARVGLAGLLQPRPRDALDEWMESGHVRRAARDAQWSP